MDAPKQSTTRPEVSGSEADINVLIYKLGKAVKRLLVLVGTAFARLGTGILLTMLFLLRNILWILLGLALGLGYGIYQLSKRGPQYYSEMTVKANFNSSRSLYNTIEYFNALIETGNSEEMSHLFEIPADRTKSLVNFSVKPVKSEIISANLYKEQFMQYDRSRKIRQDTFWTRIIHYEDFRESLTEYDYPFYAISIRATDKSVFPELQKGIFKQISNNELLLQIRRQQQISNEDEEKLIRSSIANIDSLRRAYNQRLIRGQNVGTPNSNQLTILETAPDIKTPELELYDKILELQDELKRARQRSVTEHDIMEVLAPFAPIGKKISLFDSIWKHAVLGFVIPVIILSAIAMYKALLLFDAARRKKRASVKPIN